MPEKAEMLDNTDGEKYLIFSVFDRQYAFPAEVIGEVASCDPLYSLPLLPVYVLGIINRYSIPYALFDTGFLLSNEPSSSNEALVIKGEIDHVAFSVDNVSGIASITPDKLVKIETGSESGESNNAVQASFNWNGTDVLLLDIRCILARIAQEAVK